MMNINSDIIKIMMEIGFMASNSGRLNVAETIFSGLAEARPMSSYPQIGLGCVAMGRGQFDKAVEILSNAPIQERAEHDLCQGFLGMALRLGGDEGRCREVLGKLQREGENQAAVCMAAKLLEKL